MGTTEEGTGKAEEVMDGVGVGNGNIKSSELEISNRTDDTEVVSDCAGVGEMTKKEDMGNDDAGIGDSEAIISMLVKIGKKIELVAGGKELGVNMLIEGDNSDVGKGIRIFVVLTGVGAIVVRKSKLELKSIIGVVDGSGPKISEVAREMRIVSVGKMSKELLFGIDGEGWAAEVGSDDDASTSIVEGMLKDGLDAVREGVMTITTAVVSPGGLSTSIA